MKSFLLSVLLFSLLPFSVWSQPLVFEEIFGGQRMGQKRDAKLFDLASLDPISKAWGGSGAQALAQLKAMYGVRGEYTPPATLKVADVDAMFGILLPKKFAAPSADTELSAEDYQALIDGLGAVSYKTRVNATQRLLAIGPQDDPEKRLLAAARSTDPEIRLRAVEIRESWRAASVPAPHIHYDGFSGGIRRLVKSGDIKPEVKQRLLEHCLSLVDGKRGAPPKLRRLLAPAITATVESGTPEQAGLIKDLLLNTPEEHAVWCFAACAKASDADHFNELLRSSLTSKKRPLIASALSVVGPEHKGCRAVLDELMKEEAWTIEIRMLLAGKFKDKKILEGMIEEALVVEEAEGKKAVLQQLSKVGRFHGKLPAELRVHLMPFAKDPKSELRRPAINCLAGFRDVDVLKPLFEIYLADPKKLKSPVAKAFRNFPKETKAILAAAPDTPEAKDAVKKLKRTIDNANGFFGADPFGGGDDPFGGGGDDFFAE